MDEAMRFDLSKDARARTAVRVMDSLSEGVISVDRDSSITFMNPAAARLTGWTINDAVGVSVSEVFRIVNGATKERQGPLLQTVMESNEVRILPPSSVLVRKDSTEIPIEASIDPIHDESGTVVGAVISFRDASLARVLLLKALHRALHDPLTDLPNRLLLEDRIGQALSSLQRRPHLMAVLFLDIDNFKKINDVRGHTAGDSVLRGIARRLSNAVRGSDTVCRLGGDEFVVLLPEVKSFEDLTAVCEHILSALRKPVLVDGESLLLTVSIGAVLREDTRSSAGDLIREADAAMYVAKQEGGNRLHVFTPATSPSRKWQADFESALCRALEWKEFVLLYQPQIDLKTGEILGAEALLRWNTPDGRTLPPMSFIPIAERCELIVPIGQWVFREAARQMRIWAGQGFSDLTVSVNVSPREFQNPEYVRNLDSILEENGVNPRYAMLEITESVLLSESDRETSLFPEIRQREFLLGLDDFGTGHAGFAYLRQLPIDVVKIDRSFVADSTKDEQGASLVRAMVNMGRSLGKAVIAEGIETKEQLVFLRMLDCHQGQGFLISPPVSAEALTALLQRPDSIAARLN